MPDRSTRTTLDGIFALADELRMRKMAQTFDRLFPGGDIPAWGNTPHTCKCGAEIEADQHSCAGCHAEARREHDQELDRMFPRREP